MYATASGAKTGVPRSVAREFVASDEPGRLPKHVGRAYGGGIRGYQDGGMTTALGQPQGIAPSAGTMNPIQQQQIQRYAAMTPEQLQQLAAALGPSPQGQLVQRILQQKHFMPQPAAMSAPQSQPIMNRGGEVPHMQGGGSPLGVSMGMADPPWERSQTRQATTGFLLGSTPGRADLVKARPPAGSYVWPADVLAGLGEGNGLAGANILEKALATGPMGTRLPPGRRGAGVPVPRPPHPFTGAYMAPPAASGGRANDHGGPVDIMAAHGELITPPHIAQMWGRGNMKKGHDLFDQAVLHFRKKHIEDLKGLKGPKKS